MTVAVSQMGSSTRPSRIGAWSVQVAVAVLITRRVFSRPLRVDHSYRDLALLRRRARQPARLLAGRRDGVARHRPTGHKNRRQGKVPTGRESTHSSLPLKGTSSAPPVRSRPTRQANELNHAGLHAVPGTGRR